jgi:1-phosphofructokinase family hexose kinase
MMITITPNPAIDRTLTISRIEIGGIHRTTHSLIAAGGKGLNVARVVKQLGSEVLAMGLVGGHSGRWLAELAAAEGIAGAWTWIEGEIRTCTMVVSEGNDATVLNENGPTITPAEWEQLIADVLRYVPTHETVALCGSLPPGTPASAPADLIERVQTNGGRVWVDTSGSTLRMALSARPYGVKINRYEASQIVGKMVTTVQEAIHVATTLKQQGIAEVVITLGAEGAVMVNKGGMYHAILPSVPIVSTVGSGDAFLGGLLVTIEQGHPSDVALRYATAAGTANAMSVGGGVVEMRKVEELMEGMTITKIP